MAVHISLSDDDYAVLAAAAAQQDTSIETLLHEAIAPLRLNGRYTYPTGEPDSPEEEAEEEAIAQRIGSQKPWLSEMVIEDRGPR